MADAFDELRFSGNPFTIDELVNKIRSREARPTLLIEFLEEGIQKMKKRVGTEILEITYKKYKRGVVYVKELLQEEALLMSGQINYELPFYFTKML